MENKRLLSLDAFRGFTVAAMILVNNPGNWGHVYAPLLHAEWNGITATDLVFPFFLFIVGVSVVLAFAKRLEEGSDKKKMIQKIVWRSIKIFSVGILLSIAMSLSFKDIRIAGVLQRIALVFLICSVIYLYTRWKIQAILATVLLVFYWIAMTIIPTPGYDKAMLEPGINLAAWFDGIFLPGHMYQKTWDPEGLFSTIPAIATGLTGMLAGHLIISKVALDRKVIWLFTIGFVALIVGYWWHFIFPINKNLWTSSYVLVSSGLASMTLASLLFLVDGQGYKKYAQIGVIFGSNAIAIYVLSGLLVHVFYSIHFFGLSLNAHLLNLFERVGFGLKFGSFIYALLYISINFIPAYFLYKKKIFIKL